MPELVLTRAAKEQLRSLPESLRQAVADALTLLAADPQSAGKPLLGRLKGIWSARVGNYRIIYTVEAGSRSSRVIVRAIRHRAVAYRRRPRQSRRSTQD